jgi:quercetin dioxygenase-like cupin family protein
MKQSRTVLAGLAVAAGACGAAIAAEQTASPATSAQAERVDLATGLPAFAPGYRLSLTRAVIPPGAAFPPHRHPGMQVAFIQAGTLRFTVFRGAVKVFRGPADGSQRLVRTITPRRPGSIAAGEWIVETPGLRHRGANTGDARVVILLATLLRAGEPAAIPITPRDRRVRVSDMPVAPAATGSSDVTGSLPVDVRSRRPRPAARRDRSARTGRGSLRHAASVRDG